MRILPPLIIFLLVLSLASCSLLETRSFGKRTVTVTVTGSATNDLGQVMVFSRDADNREVVMVKDFYSPFRSRSESRRLMNRYRARIVRLTSKRVAFTCHTNEAGNLVIDKMIIK